MSIYNKTMMCRSIYNWWDYYLVRCGFKKQAELMLKTYPDKIIFDIDKKYLQENKGAIKTTFSIIADDRLKYYRSEQRVSITDETGQIENNCDWGIKEIEALSWLLQLDVEFEKKPGGLFLIKNILGKGEQLLVKNLINEMFAFEEIFLKDEYECLYPYVKDSVILDIGAHNADTSLLFHTKGAKKIYGYEPHPETFDLALRNIKLNKIDDKVEMYNFGVGLKSESIYLDSFASDSAIYQAKAANKIKDKGVEIKIIPFKDMIKGKDNIDILKMDCEGAEFDAILSCPGDVLKKIKIMAVEYHDEPDRLVKCLQETGYDVQIIKDEYVANKKVGLLFAALK